VQEVPITYVSGTFIDHVYFNTHGSNNSQQFDLLAIITRTTLHAAESIKTLPKTLAEDHETTKVQ
jgi:hypothetical protein